MKTIYLIACGFLLAPALMAQAPDTLYYSLLFTDNQLPGEAVFNMSVADASLIDEAIPKKKNENTLVPMAVTSGLLLVSGFCDGTSEVLKIKYDRFSHVFPNANDQFWNYNISWKNKYKDGTPPDAAFPGSKTSLVWTTDGYHMMRAMRNATMITALVIPLHNISKKNWKNYLQQGIINYFAYTAGFNLAYDVVFR